MAGWRDKLIQRNTGHRSEAQETGSPSTDRRVADGPAEVLARGLEGFLPQLMAEGDPLSGMIGPFVRKALDRLDDSAAADIGNFFLTLGEQVRAASVAVKEAQD